MCNPVAFAVAGEAIGFAQESKNASAINKAQDKAFEQTVRLTGAARDLRDSAIREAQIQDSARAVDEIRKNRERAERALGLTRVAGAESGVAGGALSSVLADFQRQEAQEALTIITNRDRAAAASEKDLAASKLSTESTILGAVPVPVAGPNLLQTLLGIGGSIAMGDAKLQKSKTAAGKTSDTPWGSSLFGEN